jgi:ATP-dependent Clp protease protease subunit
MTNCGAQVHEASGSYSSHQVSDVLIQAEELKEKNEILLSVLSEHTGKSVEEIRPLVGRNKYMTAKEACALGLIDSVLTRDAAKL